MSVSLVTAVVGRDVVPWPWPLAPLFLLVLVAVGALVVFLVDRYVIGGEE